MSWTAPRTWVTGELVTGSLMNTHLRDNMNALLPIATYIYRAAPYTDVATTVEGRWLQCNGVTVSRTTYSDLFTYFNGLTPALPFGTGDGVTTFALPDFRGRSAYGQGTHADVDTLGESEGLTLASRGPSHHHFTQLEGGGANGGEPGRGNTLDTGVFAQTTGGGASNKPSYIVAGSWFIKYTL